MRPKVSSRAQVKALKFEIARLRSLAEERLHMIDQLRYEAEELKRQLQSRVETAQLASRERLAASIATLMEASAHAIQYTVAKESI